MRKKLCENCIWRDQCAQAEACEYYSPANSEEEEEMMVAEYEEKLRLRQEEYMELVEEQNS